MQTGSLAFEPRPRPAPVAHRLSFFSPLPERGDGESARRQTGHRICRSAVSATRAIHQSFHPILPTFPYGPGTANEILQRRSDARVRSCIVSVCAMPRACSARTMRVLVHARLCVDVHIPVRACVCVSLYRLSGYAENELVDG